MGDYFYVEKTNNYSSMIIFSLRNICMISNFGKGASQVLLTFWPPYFCNFILDLNFYL